MLFFHKIYSEYIVKVTLMKKFIEPLLIHFPKIISVAFLITAILINPEVSVEGIKSGISLLLNTIIPSLFPFMVISSYIASSNSFAFLAGVFKKITAFLFRANPDGFIPFLLGLLGGYPIGAKTTADLYKANRLTQNEAERLMYFTVNSGPAFTVTAVGIGMLNNYRAGLILYASNILTSLSIGFLCRFLNNKEVLQKRNITLTTKENAFIKSVSSGADAIINISAWVLIFSCVSSIVSNMGINENFSLFFNCITEVTNGCKISSKTQNLPVISAILGFGGFSVICQVAPYLKECNVKMKNFVASRLLNSALSAFFTAKLNEFFPCAEEASVIYATESRILSVSYTIPATFILIIMCLFFVLQVDNRKKVC